MGIKKIPQSGNHGVAVGKERAARLKINGGCESLLPEENNRLAIYT